MYWSIGILFGLTYFKFVKRRNPQGLDRPWGFQEVEALRFQDNRHMKVVRLSALRTSCLTPQEIFLVLISLKRLSWPQGQSVAGRIMSMQKCNIIRNQTCDLPACSTVPEPTVPLHALFYCATPYSFIQSVECLWDTATVHIMSLL